jgi:hypothetical protein
METTLTGIDLSSASPTEIKRLIGQINQWFVEYPNIPLEKKTELLKELLDGVDIIVNHIKC